MSTMQRNLTLTEELERLEQQITLTLQEIDSNFSKAHRIVTSSILPIVEEYAKHSNEVWEGSKFWKEFFEASANVSLSGYEEPADETVTHTDATESFQTPTNQDESTMTGAESQEGEEEEFSVDSPTQVTGDQATPKLPPSTTKRMQAGTRPQNSSRPTSSYKSPTPRKYTGKNQLAAGDISEQPSTPRMQSAADLQSSPFEPESAFQPSAFNTTRNNDPLMHRAILDKNYRIQATPHTQRQQRQRPMSVKTTPATATKKTPWDDSPQSSPEIAAPQLRSELFSPAKVPGRAAPRTPGVSVLTPAAKKTNYAAPKTSTGVSLFSPNDKAYVATKEHTRASHLFDDSEEDDYDFADLSPPKTMQFHIPQSRLVQTPAREASKKIVDDLLLTAGADATDDIEGEGEEFDDPSPSVVRRAYDVEDDTF